MAPDRVIPPPLELYAEPIEGPEEARALRRSRRARRIHWFLGLLCLGLLAAVYVVPLYAPSRLKPLLLVGIATAGLALVIQVASLALAMREPDVPMSALLSHVRAPWKEGTETVSQPDVATTPQTDIEVGR